MTDNNIYPIFDRMLSREDKEELLGQHSVMIWFTGLSGSGKSTIAIALERASSMKIGRFAVMRYVLVKYGTRGKCAVLLPVKEDMFIKTLTNRLNEVKKY